jgi:hypothetical protein
VIRLNPFSHQEEEDEEGFKIEGYLIGNENNEKRTKVKSKLILKLNLKINFDPKF